VPCSATSSTDPDHLQLDQRRPSVTGTADRGYEDFVEGRISQDFWNRRSAEWETKLQTIEAEQARVQQPKVVNLINGQKILELAKQAESLYKSQDPAEQRRLLETVLSNCTFDRGSLFPTYSSPFDLLVRGNQT
jgi:site-specific DNA recombinase